MGKRNINITLDNDIAELVDLKRMQNPQFNLSADINEYLRNYFKVDLKDLNVNKVKNEIMMMEKTLARLKSQEQSIELENKKQKDKDDLEWIKKIDRENGII
jgi:hypothetical protein